MSSIAKNIAKQSVKEVLAAHAASQINLASPAAREVLASLIVLEVEKRVNLSMRVSSPIFCDKTLTVDMEDKTCD